MRAETLFVLLFALAMLLFGVTKCEQNHFNTTYYKSVVANNNEKIDSLSKVIDSLNQENFSYETRLNECQTSLETRVAQAEAKVKIVEKMNNDIVLTQSFLLEKKVLPKSSQQVKTVDTTSRVKIKIEEVSRRELNNIEEDTEPVLNTIQILPIEFDFNSGDEIEVIWDKAGRDPKPVRVYNKTRNKSVSIESFLEIEEDLEYLKGTKERTLFRKT